MLRRTGIRVRRHIPLEPGAAVCATEQAEPLCGSDPFPTEPHGRPSRGDQRRKSARRRQTQLDGRTVERIRIDTACPPRANCPRGPVYLYVDPETFYPVEIVATFDQVEIVGGPGTSSYSHVRVRDVTRYATFEYLPRTAANLALTDIRAQHPNATGPSPLQGVPPTPVRRPARTEEEK